MRVCKMQDILNYYVRLKCKNRTLTLMLHHFMFDKATEVKIGNYVKKLLLNQCEKFCFKVFTGEISVFVVGVFLCPTLYIHKHLTK